MEKWTNQTAFTAAAKGMLSQMERSEGDHACMYRGCGGLKCGVGFLLPDELAVQADSEINTDISNIMEVIPEVEVVFSGVDLNLLVSVQEIHDFEPTDRWEVCLKQLAEDFDLEWEG